MQGDGPLAAFAYTIIDNLRNQLQGHTLETYDQCILPIVNESIDSLGHDATQAERDHERQRIEDYVFTRIDAAKAYFNDHFVETNNDAPPRIGDNNFGHLHSMFEAFALTDPEHVRNKLTMEYQLHPEDMIPYIREKLTLLVNMERIDIELKTALMGNIGPYLHTASTFSYGNNRKQHEKYIQYIQFWKEQRYRLPHWYEFVKVTLLHHPNSCGSERLFSLLKYILESEHEQCLDDYICAAVYAAYNHRHDNDRIRDEI